MPTADALTTDRRPLTTAALLLWEQMPTAPTSLLDLASLPTPSVVLHPGAAEDDRVICLAAVGFAYRARAVAFAPAHGWTSVTLLEARGVPHPELELAAYGLVDLLSLGWAARAGAIRFSHNGIAAA